MSSPRKTSSREVFRCPGCEKREVRSNKTSQYCRCDPRAPFRMIPLSVTRAVGRVIRRTRGPL